MNKNIVTVSIPLFMGILDIVVLESDDTDYLLSSKKNEQPLDQSILEIENNDVVKKNLQDPGL